MKRERLNIEADLKLLGYQLERRRAIRDLQIREYEHPFLWRPKFLLMHFVCLYRAAREAHRPPRTYSFLI